MAEKRVHIIVSGRVQGVGFRFTVQNWAKALNLKGWARNLLDGGVEIVAEGEKSALDKFVEKIKIGSAPGIVSSCKIEFEVPTGKFFGFEIMY